MSYEVIDNYIKNKFQVDIYNFQHRIIKAILNPYIKKISIRASTRIGKSYSVGLASLLYPIFNKKKKVGIIAPTKDKTKIIMSYIADFLAVSDLEDLIDLDVMQLTKLERLKREVSKNKITFKNGSFIECLSADNKGKGFTLMGKGYDLIIIDESSLLNRDSWVKIYRMLLESPHTKIVEIGNPFFLNHFFDHSLDPDWHTIHLNWRDAVKEGRMTMEQVEDQRKELDPQEFEILMEANFVEDWDCVVIPHSKILACVDLHLKEPERFKKTSAGGYVLGGDIARGGKDKTVLTILWKDQGFIIVEKIITMNTDNTQHIVNRILELNSEYKFIDIVIDDLGVGSGVSDPLRNIPGINLTRFKAGEKPSGTQANKFEKRKYEAVWRVRELIYNKEISILDDKNLIRDLATYKKKFTASGKIATEDNKDKSPDYGDSLCLGCYSQGTCAFAGVGI